MLFHDNRTVWIEHVGMYTRISIDAFGDFGPVNTIADGVSITAGATHVWTYTLLDFKKQSKTKVRGSKLC